MFCDLLHSVTINEHLVLIYNSINLVLMHYTSNYWLDVCKWGHCSLVLNTTLLKQERQLGMKKKYIFFYQENIFQFYTAVHSDAEQWLISKYHKLQKL